MKTKYTIDVDKWRCGRDGPNQLGEGLTKLRNSSDYCCCLGFITIQEGFNPGSWGMPNNVGQIPRLVDEAGEITPLTQAAVGINDDLTLPLKDRVQQLRKLFAAEGVTLHFKNLKKHLQCQTKQPS